LFRFVEDRKVVALLVSEKDPKRIRAGQIAARARWGEPRVLRLDDLSAEQRRLILALVNAARSEDDKAAPDAA
jgi:hypothetical protein